MLKIGIYGGTFNPVHIEHINLVKCAIKELNLDKIIVVPDFLPPHKDVIPAPANDRLNMLRLAFENEKKVEVSDYEILNGGRSYSYLTVEHFKKENQLLYFIVGGDMLTNFKTWKYPERILKNATLAVFDREDFLTDYKAEQEYFKNVFNTSFIKLKYRGKSLSSTKIRIYSSFNLPVDGMTDKKVIEYIKSNDLFKGDKYSDFVRENLTEKRLVHTAGVIETALKKAGELNLDKEKVRIACTLHDCAKYLKKEDYKDFSLPSDVPEPVIHAFLGAFIAEKVLGVCDFEIIDAIRYHTSGKANMTTLSKLVFVADMIEENRTYEGVEELRKAFNGDFEDCFKLCLKEEYLHLQNKAQKIYCETENAYNYYIKKEN